MKSVQPKPQRHIRLLGACLLILSVPVVAVQDVAAQERASKRVAAEKYLGPIGPVDLSKRSATNPDYWTSPDGRRFAYAIEKGFVVDGVTKEYSISVKPETFSFSPDSRRTVYVVRVSRGQNDGRNDVLVLDGQEGTTLYSNLAAPVFSPDSRHVACIARLSASSFDSVILIDGREVGKAEGFNWELAFTADSRRVVYAVESGDKYTMREEIVDGSEPPIVRTHGPAKLRGNFVFGPAGQLGYVATDAKGDFVFYDGREDALRFEEIDSNSIIVSADGKHLAYVAEPDSFEDVAVVDGRPSKVYRGLDGDIREGSLELSPDGRRSGYAVEDGNKSHVVIDGRPGKFYDAVGGPVFSPDSQHVAHLAAAGGKVFSVVNGREGQGYDDRGPAVFGPDSKSAAFWAEAGGRQFIVHNGQKQKAYDSVGTPEFSPHGKRLVYRARTGDKTLLVETGKEHKRYDDIEAAFYFSDDSRRLAVVVVDGDKEMVVVDGIEGNRYDRVVTLGGAKVHFDSPDSIHYLAAKGGELFLVEEMIQD